MTTAFPLAWPDGQPRTRWRETPKFRRATFDTERRELTDELTRLCASSIVLSTNIQLRQDGHPYSGRRQPDDPGVAVYFRYKGESMVFACDKWKRIEHNIRAIMKTIEALRGIARWGSGDMMKRAFAGFKALPPSGSDWRAVFGLRGTPSLDEVKLRFRELAARAHPDAGGNQHEMVRLNDAYSAARLEVDR